MILPLPLGFRLLATIGPAERHPPGFEALIGLGRMRGAGRFGGDALLIGLGWDAEMPWSIWPAVLRRVHARGHATLTATWAGLCLIVCRGAA